MNLLGLGTALSAAKDLVQGFFPPGMTEEQQAAAALGIEKLLAERDQAILATRREVMVAEMAQGDNYTKRARPTIVYAGLLFIALVHVLLPALAFLTGRPPPELRLPEEFWWAWSGVCGVWVVGRTMEKRGAAGPWTKILTGN